MRPLGSPSSRAPALFGAGHAAAVGLVVHAEQVKHAVEHQDANSSSVEWPNSRAWARARASGDGEVAEDAPSRCRDAGNESTSVA